MFQHRARTAPEPRIRTQRISEEPLAILNSIHGHAALWTEAVREHADSALVHERDPQHLIGGVSIVPHDVGFR